MSASRTDERVRQQRQLAGRRQAVSGAQHEFVRSRARRDFEADDHAASRGLAEIGLAGEEILLVADEVARGEKPAVEVARPLAPRILDQGARRAQRLDVFRRDQLAGGACGVIDHRMLLHSVPAAPSGADPAREQRFARDEATAEIVDPHGFVGALRWIVGPDRDQHPGEKHGGRIEAGRVAGRRRDRTGRAGAAARRIGTEDRVLQGGATRRDVGDCPQIGARIRKPGESVVEMIGARDQLQLVGVPQSCRSDRVQRIERAGRRSSASSRARTRRSADRHRPPRRVPAARRARRRVR